MKQSSMLTTVFRLLAGVRGLVNDEVDLTRNGLAADPKQGSFSGGEEIDWVELERVTWVV